MKKYPWTKLTLFIIILVCELAAGYYINHVRQLISGDALSRVANAFYVLYLDPPHLAAMGFVWNPLPSFIELPILAFWRLYPPLASSGLAGVVMTAVFAAGTAVLIYSSFIEFGHSKWLAATASLLYAFNPYIFLYGANGMSEAVYIFMIIWAVIHLTKWMEDGTGQHIIKIAFALCFAFLTRYEAVPFIAGIAFCVAIVIFMNRRKEKDREPLARIEATWMVLLTPAVFSVIMWVAYNYIIMGNAFYFLNSSYSNVGQSGSITNDASIAAVLGRPHLAALFVLKKSVYFLAPFLLIIVNRIFRRRLFRKDFVILLILVASSYVMQFGLLLKGLSAAWLRYYVYVLPIAVAWLPYELKNVKPVWKVSNLFTGFAVTGILTLFILINSHLAPDQFNVLGYKEEGLSIPAQNEIAKYINKNEPNAKVWMDSFTTFSIILNSDHPHNIVTSSSYNFYDVLEDPKEGNIDLMILPNPQTDLGKLDAINQQYPGIYENGADWCRLEKVFRNYKLFRIVKN